LAVAGYDFPGMWDQPPTGAWSSTAWNSIGAPVYSSTTASGASLIQSIQYSVDGGAVQSQTWTPTTADYVPTQGVTHSAPPFFQTDSWQFYWDENPGHKTVTNTVTYADGSVWVAQTSVDTLAPTGNITLGITDASLGNWQGSGPWGLWSGGSAQYGVTYQGTITMPMINGGLGGFVQVINKNNLDILPGGVSHGLRYPPDLYAEDGPKNVTVPYYGSDKGYNVALAANDTTNVGGIPSMYSQYFPTDAPGTSISPPVILSSFTYSLKTYLDYQPPGGLHIELAQATWSISGSASYNGPAAGTLATYQDPANWTVNSSHTGPNVSTGPQLIKWTMNSNDADAQYAY
jgi:hypothetical protein